MNADNLMLAAFVVFILLVGWRMRERWAEGEEKTLGPDGGRLARVRKWWAIVQLVVLGGLAVYMVPLLWADFRAVGERDTV